MSAAIRAGGPGAGAGWCVHHSCLARMQMLKCGLFVCAIKQEYIASALSTHNLRVMVCKGGDATPEFVAPFHAAKLPVGKGEFTYMEMHVIFSSWLSRFVGAVKLTIISTEQVLGVPLAIR